MGCRCCCVSKEGTNSGNGSDGRNESGDAEGSSHGTNNLGDTGPLLQKAEVTTEDHGYKTFNDHTDQLSQDNAEKERLLDENMKLIKENEMLNQQLLQQREIAEETRAALEEARKKTIEDTRAMSHIMELRNTGGHEAANNPFSPTKLGARMKTVYEDQGLPLMEYFDDEVEGARFVSNWIKSCYDVCKRKADFQMTKFCLLDGMKLENVDQADENWIRSQMRMMMREDELEYMYYLRWKTASSKEAIERVKQEVSVAFSFNDEKYSHLYADETKTAAVKSFLQMCAETCWLIATCRPALHLQFDVENRKYESWIQKAFRVFATQKKVQSLDTPPGVIVAVVCPALLTVDDSIIMQGEVIRTDFNSGKVMEEGRSESMDND